MPVRDLIARQQRLGSERSVWESHWQDIADLMHPRRAEFNVIRTPGQKRTEKIFDGTPLQAARGLAASMDGLLRSRTSRWAGIRTADDDLGERREVKAWLEDAEERMFKVLYNPAARFLQRSAEVDLDLVVFGTGVMFIGEAVGAGRLLFRAHHLKDSFICENAAGDIDTIFRPFRLTARQAGQRFGRDNLSSRMTEAMDSNKDVDTLFSFMHAVLPSEDWDGRRVNQKFASIWMEVEAEHLIAEMGFEEFPYIVPRWDTSAEEVYGRSPAMIALADVQTLNQMGKTILRAGHKAVEPALAIPHDGLHSAPRTWPGANTYFNSSILEKTRGRSPIFPIESGANLPLGLEMQERTRDMVQAAFFRNVLQLPTSGPQMTATEILQRREEFMRIIGPTFGRLEADYNGPTIERVFNVMMRAGAFSEPPDALKGEEVRFEFQSAVSRIGKLVEAAAFGKTMADLEPMGVLDPTIFDHFNNDEISRDIAEANGMPQKWLKDMDEVDALREQRQQTIAAEQDAEAAERVLAGAATIAEMPVGQQEAA